MSDTLGLINGTNVSFGNIGTGYTYPLPSAQITYRTPDLAGFKLAVGLIDPAHTTEPVGEESAPRFEGELTYSHAFGPAAVTAWVGFLFQNSENDAADTEVDSRGFSYGVRATMGGLALHASGFTAEGVGFLLGPSDHTLGFALTQNGDEIDSDGYLLQASFTHGPSRLVASYGENKFETDPDEWENKTVTGAYFHTFNDYLKLVAEYNVNTISLGSAEEKTNTVALGAIINF